MEATTHSGPYLRDVFAPSCLRGCLLVLLLSSTSLPAADPTKPKVAVFPIQGDAKEDLRERTGFSLRTKLDRTGKFDVIDGPRMQDLVTENSATVSLQTSADQVREWAKQVEADLALWGELSGAELKVKMLDLRDAKAEPKEVDEAVKQPQDLRFAVEDVLKQVQGVADFAHPVEQSVWDDAQSQKLWKTNPNLLINGDFSQPGKWTGIYQSELYPVPIQGDTLPADKVAIVKAAGEQANALVLNLSKACAENNGLAALSDAIKIESGVRYRLQFRYKSDGPVLHVFVKGYTRHPGPTGQTMEREIYRRQVPVSGSTDDQWVTVTDDLNPQHVQLPVQTLRVDLYAYLKPGTVMFEEVVLKAVGKQTRDAKDAAIKPTTR